MIEKRKLGKKGGENRGSTGMLKEHRHETMKKEGARSCSMAWGSHARSLEQDLRLQERSTIVPDNFWVKFSKYRILARDGSAKFLASCFWPFYGVLVMCYYWDLCLG